jgi:hypothetical protein
MQTDVLALAAPSLATITAKVTNDTVIQEKHLIKHRKYLGGGRGGRTWRTLPLAGFALPYDLESFLEPRFPHL